MGMAALGGCATSNFAHAGTATAQARAAQAATDPDRLLELAALLPPGADRCVLARPGRIAKERRPLLARMSQADRFAWQPELGVAAYASVLRERRDGPSTQTTLLFIDAAQAGVLAAFAAHSGLALGWGEDDQACGGGPCAAHAVFVAPHILRITRGEVPADSAPGVEVACVQSAQRDANAIEFGVQRERSLTETMPGAVVKQSTTRLRATLEGVRLVRDDVQPNLAEPEWSALEQLRRTSEAWPLGIAGATARYARSAAGLHTEIDVLWEDLELTQGDEARLRNADQLAKALAGTLPDGAAEAYETEDVLAEVGFQLGRMRETQGDEHRAHAVAARGVLERASARNPADDGLALLLVELLLTEFKEPRAAQALLARVAGEKTSAPRRAKLVRHAAALDGETALAAALVRDGLADRKRAHIYAGEIVARMREGGSFDQAEQMVLGRAQ